MIYIVVRQTIVTATRHFLSHLTLNQIYSYPYRKIIAPIFVLTSIALVIVPDHHQCQFSCRLALSKHYPFSSACPKHPLSAHLYQNFSHSLRLAFLSIQTFRPLIRLTSRQILLLPKHYLTFSYTHHYFSIRHLKTHLSGSALLLVSWFDHIIGL